MELYVKDTGTGGLDWVALSQDAKERLEPLVPRRMLRELDEMEQSGVLGDTITEIFEDASDNGLGEAVNDVLADAVESEAGEKLRDAGETVGILDEKVGETVTGIMDAAHDGVVGDTIDSALDTAASGVVGEAVNETVHTARVEIVRAIAVRTSAYVHLILLCLIWVLLMVALTIIKNTLGLATKLPVVKHVDKLGGAGLGLIECALAFWCLAWLDKVTGFGWLAQTARGTVFLKLFV